MKGQHECESGSEAVVDVGRLWRARRKEEVEMAAEETVELRMYWYGSSHR